MKTFNRVCIEDFTVVDADKNIAQVKRGQEYLTSEPYDDGTVIVFTNYWFKVPLIHFAGERKFT